MRNCTVYIKAPNGFSCCRTRSLIINYSGLKSILMKGRRNPGAKLNSVGGDVLKSEWKIRVEV